MITAMALVVAFSQVPIVYLYSYIYFRDAKGREPLALLIKTFFVGALMCFPAGFLESFVGVQTEPSSVVGPVTLFASAFLVGLIEEGLKYFALRVYPYRRAEFDEPYDGIMYSVSISLGFAALENLIYVAMFGLSTAFVRMFTAVPMHAMAAVIMGYEVGRAKFALSPAERDRFLRKALWFPILLHGLYDFFLFLRTPYTSVLALAVLAWQLRIMKTAMAEFAMHVPGRIEGIIIPPSPPAPSLGIPPRLSHATYSLGVVVITGTIGAFLLGFALLSPDNLSGDEYIAASITLGVSVVMLPILFFARRRLLAGSRGAWVLALGTFIVLLATPIFPVALVGLGGLLNERSREYFWTHRGTPVTA